MQYHYTIPLLKNFETTFEKTKKGIAEQECLKNSSEIEKRAQHEAIRTSILANDYDAFTKAFLAATPTLPTEEEFNTMIQRHEEMTASKTTLNKETKRQKRANQARQKRTRNTQ